MTSNDQDDDIKKKTDISYSIILDKKYNNNKEIIPLKYTLPKKIHNWIQDENVNKCYHCNKEFSFFLRKHHCRLCGKIFCFGCSKFRDIIPENLLPQEAKKSGWNDYFKSYVKNIDLTKHRVCIFCHELIEKINLVKKLIEVFRIVKLNIKEIKKIGQVCQIWNYATNYYLSIFKEIQYKLPINDYNDYEKDLLWVNSEYLVGHNKYFVHLLKICENEYQINYCIKLLNKKKKTDCLSLMCSRNCKNQLTAIDSINLIAHFFKYKPNLYKLLELALNNLNCSNHEFKIYLPFLVYNINFDCGILSRYLVNKCIKSHELLNYLYWELLLYEKSEKHKKILNEIRDLCSEQKNEDKFICLMQGINFINIIKEISSDICEKKKSCNEIKKKYTLKNDLILPIDPSKKIKSINIEKIIIKNSATKPIIIPCVTDKNKIYKIMFKKEEIRQDQIILNIINLVEIILKNDENLDIHIVNYNILPIDNDIGLVEIVDNCQTVYYIIQKMKTSILNYILENNENLKIKEIREKFIKSTAAYSVITYLLGVGDRHLDNIMVTNDGRLFHIDFGYILGKDPVFSNPGIRITPDIVDAIGGFNSIYYTYFKENCSKIYNCLRRNIDIFMNLLLLLPKITRINTSEEDIIQQILKRFIPGENEIDSQIHLVNQLEKQYYTDKIKDWCHYHSKEQTIGSTVDRISNVLSSLWNPQKVDKNKDFME